MSSTYKLIYAATGQVVAEDVRRANSLLERGIGLLGQGSLGANDGLWLPNVGSVHTIGMRFPIDVLFLDEAYRCSGWKSNVGAWRFAVGERCSLHTVELGAGTLSGISMLKMGDVFDLLQRN